MSVHRDSNRGGEDYQRRKIKFTINFLDTNSMTPATKKQAAERVKMAKALAAAREAKAAAKKAAKEARAKEKAAKLKYGAQIIAKMKAKGIPLSGDRAKQHLQRIEKKSQKKETKSAAKALLEGLEENSMLLSSTKFKPSSIAKAQQEAQRWRRQNQRRLHDSLRRCELSARARRKNAQVEMPQ